MMKIVTDPAYLKARKVVESVSIKEQMSAANNYIYLTEAHLRRKATYSDINMTHHYEIDRYIAILRYELSKRLQQC